MAVPTRHSESEHAVAGFRTFFVTSSTFEKRYLLQSDRTASLFIDLLYELRRQKRFSLHEFVVMPNHFHLLLTVGPESSIERAVQFIKGGFAFRAGKKLGLRSPVWQRGFSEVRVLSRAQFEVFRGYIRENPVCARIVECASDFPYSSAHPGFESDAPPQWLKPTTRLAVVGTPQGVP
jgi:putative transposase